MLTWQARGYRTDRPRGSRCSVHARRPASPAGSAPRPAIPGPLQHHPESAPADASSREPCAAVREIWKVAPASPCLLRGEPLACRNLVTPPPVANKPLPPTPQRLPFLYSLFVTELPESSPLSCPQFLLPLAPHTTSWLMAPAAAAPQPVRPRGGSALDVVMAEPRRAEGRGGRGMHPHRVVVVVVDE